MTDSKDSAVDEGTQEQPNSEGSQKSGQQGSSTETALAKQIEELNRKLDKLASERQSEKDRAVKRTNQRVDVLEGNLREILQSYASQGKGNISDVLSDIDAQEEQESRQAMRELAIAMKTGKFPGMGSGGTEQIQSVDVSEMVKELELDSNDMRVKEFMSRNFKSEAEAAKEAAKLVKTIATNRPSDADKPSDVATRQVSATQQEKLMNEYKEGSKNLRGMALINYKQVMRKKGLDIQ
jgi:outer membrane murein-binding lipoprotein Lpp